MARLLRIDRNGPVALRPKLTTLRWRMAWEGDPLMIVLSLFHLLLTRFIRLEAASDRSAKLAESDFRKGGSSEREKRMI